MNSKYHITLQEDGRFGFSCESVQDAIDLMNALRGGRKTETATPAVPSPSAEKKRIGRPPKDAALNVKTVKTNFSKMTFKDLGKADRRARWTDDEVKRFHDLLTQGTDRKLIVSDPILTKKHSPNSINALYYAVKDNAYIKLGYNTAFYRRYDACRRLANGESLQAKQDAYNAGGDGMGNGAPIPSMGWTRSSI